MKAVVYTAYGPPEVLRLQEVAKPTPKEGEVLIKVHAVALNAADWHLLRGDPFIARLEFGLRSPKYKILGADVAGQVEAVGANVTQFQPGDAVFGDLAGCGWGGLAEHVCVRADMLAPKPTNLTFEEAAAVSMAAVTALQGLRDKGRLQPGQKVLINGASGGVGTFAVQIARALGAEVTAVCSTRNVEMVAALGATHVIDYTREDFTRNGRKYDLVLAANGNRSLAEYRRARAPNGVYVMTGGAMAQMMQALLQGPLYSLGRGQTFGNLLARPNQKDLLFVKDLLEAGTIAPVIDRRYPLDEVVEAFRYLEEGHARGKVVITVVQR